MAPVKLRYLCILAVAFVCAAAPAAAREGGEGVRAASAGGGEEAAETVAGRALPDLAPGSWEPLFEMGESMYPSVVISTATLKGGLWDEKDEQHLGDPWGMIGVAVRGTGPDTHVRVEIAGGSFLRPSAWNGTLPDKDAVYCVYPVLKYDYEKLLAVRQTVPEMLTFRVVIGKKAFPERTVRVQVRPINECVFTFIDSSGATNDVSYFFAAYVNENHPFISKVMKEALDAKRSAGFSGYQGDRDDVLSEIGAIWDTLKRRGMHYSTMPASADDDDPNIGSQYVRLLGESIDYAQANCVDGSVLMASIFRKMGLHTSLIELPDHMFVAVDLDPEGRETVFIETTALDDSTLEEAIEAGTEQYEENKDKFDSRKEDEQDYNIIDIQDARLLGIMPIKDAAAQ